MTHDTRTDLTPDERRRLDALPRELAPPAQLEDRVAQALRDRGGLGPSRPWTLRGTVAVAAALVLLVAGFGAGRVTHPADALPAPPHYLLLLYEGPGFDPDGRSEAELVQEYRDWAGRLAGQGRLIEARKLAGVEHRLGPATVVEASTQSLGGFFLVAARDDTHALEIARDSPHARYGGTIVVRPVEGS